MIFLSPYLWYSHISGCSMIGKVFSAGTSDHRAARIHFNICSRDLSHIHKFIKVRKVTLGEDSQGHKILQVWEAVSHDSKCWMLVKPRHSNVLSSGG